MSHLTFALLGPPNVRSDGRLVDFPTRKTLALLSYLAVEGGRHSREKLAALLWPESEPAQGRTTLRSTLALLRDALGEPLPQLLATRDSLALELGSDDLLDVSAV